MLKKGIIMTLIAILLLGQSVPTYAWSIGGAINKAKNWTSNAVDDATDWTNNAVDDATDWTNNAVDDATDWTNNAVDDATDWTNNAVDDATDWTNNAVDDATDWTSNAVDDATDWTNNAVDDATNWTNNAVDDATDWTNNALDDSADWLDNAYDDTSIWLNRAYRDVDQFMDDLLRGNENLSEIDLLPVLNMDMNTVYNSNKASDGIYTYGDNVRDQKLPPEAEAALKSTLLDIGLTNYWANYCITELSEASGQISPGSYIADMLPYSMFYGDRVADAIDDVLMSYTMMDIDPFSEAILPESDVNGMSFTYKFNQGMLQSDGHYLVMVTGLHYGLRDNFTVTLKSGDQIIPTTKKALNHEQVAFVAVVNNPNNLEIMYNNTFERPVDIAFEVADGIQDGINDLVPFGNPISNGARDDIKDVINNSAILLESKHTDKNGKEKTDTTEVSLNDVLGDGDMGVILTEAVYAIPVVGPIIKPIMKVSGGDDALASLIRKAINQAEVKSYASYKEGAIYIKAYTTEAAMRAELTGAVENASVNAETLAETSGVELPSYDNADEAAVDESGEKTFALVSEFDTMPLSKIMSGSFTLNRAYTDSIYAVSSDDTASLMLFNNLLFSNGTIESKITLYDAKANAENNAGIVFRAVASGMGDGSYYGYAIKLTPDTSGGKGSVSLVSISPSGSKTVAQKTMSLLPRTVYDVKIVADGNKMTVYIDDQKALLARDSDYGIGSVGFSNINIPAIYQNIGVSE